MITIRKKDCLTLVLAFLLVLTTIVPTSALTGQKIVYGQSGEGRELVAWRYGSGENVLVVCFAMHGFEDNWAYDGKALVYSADKLREFLQSSSLPKLHNWSVYVLPCLNPDGLHSGWTNNGPGRCTTTYLSGGKLISGKGIDMNRCFPTRFKSLSSSRNYTTGTPMACMEARALSSFIQQVRGSKVNVLIDIHGWLQQTITTSSRIKSALQANFSSNRLTSNNGGGGYLITYAHSMGYEVGLLELPAHFSSYSQYTSSDCTSRIIDSMKRIIQSEQTPCSKNGHKYEIRQQEADCTNSGYYEKRCSVCGDGERHDYPALGHNMNAGSLVTLRDPTACRPGLQSYQCSRCGTSLTKQLPAIFQDVNESAFYADSVDQGYDMGIVRGCSNHRFCPEAALTRAMTVEFLARISGDDVSLSPAAPFTDVAPGVWYAQAVNWAYENQVVMGTSDTTFSPEELVTREDFVTMMMRYLRTQEDIFPREPDGLTYTDLDSISDYAVLSVSEAQALELVMGYPDGSFRPTDHVDRAEGVTFLMRLIRCVENWEIRNEIFPDLNNPESSLPDASTPVEQIPEE